MLQANVYFKSTLQALKRNVPNCKSGILLHNLDKFCVFFKYFTDMEHVVTYEAELENHAAYPAGFTHLSLTIETLEQGVKCVQS